VGNFCCQSRGFCAGTKETTEDLRISGSASPEYEAEGPIAGPPLLHFVFGLEPVKDVQR
jgi:hypothetical protein